MDITLWVLAPEVTSHSQWTISWTFWSWGIDGETNVGPLLFGPHLADMGLDSTQATPWTWTIPAPAVSSSKTTGTRIGGGGAPDSSRSPPASSTSRSRTGRGGTRRVTSAVLASGWLDRCTSQAIVQSPSGGICRPAYQRLGLIAKVPSAVASGRPGTETKKRTAVIPPTLPGSSSTSGRGRRGHVHPTNDSVATSAPTASGTRTTSSQLMLQTAHASTSPGPPLPAAPRGPRRDPNQRRPLDASEFLSGHLASTGRRGGRPAGDVGSGAVTDLAYTVRRSPRARRVRVTVEPDGVEVVLPRRAAQREAAAAVAELRPWIERRLGELERARAALARPAGHVPYLGELLRLAPEPGRSRAHRRGDELLVPAGDWRPAAERWYRRAARAEVAARLDDATARTGRPYTALTIRGQRTRWASCSPTGAMSFNWRLLLAPDPVLDYVVWHEVCHLEVCDHSPRFWALLERRWPRYREDRRWLRRYGAALAL